MKKLLKITCLVIIMVAAMKSICLADVIMAGDDPRYHGMGRYPNGYENTYVNKYENNETKNRAIKSTDNEFDMDIIKVAVIGVLIITIVICATIIIVQIIKTGKEKNND